MQNTRHMNVELAYQTRLEEAQAAQKSITEKLKAHPTVGVVNWAHVGDITQLVACLEDADTGL